MGENLAMQNNLSGEEPAEHFKRAYGLSIFEASKNESTYVSLVSCGAKISLDEYMRLVGKEKLTRPEGFDNNRCLTCGGELYGGSCYNADCPNTDLPF